MSGKNLDRLSEAASDFQCMVCGAVFTTDRDRMQHLEKEMHGAVRPGTTEEEKEVAREQERLNEGKRHVI
ncbi:MAG: hypothetical protein AB1753_04465 [Thermoproteota archaeon]